MRPPSSSSEALRGLRRSSAPSLAALLTVLLTALVLGVFIPIVQATTGTANEVRSRVVVDVYVKDAATQAQQSRAEARARGHRRTSSRWSTSRRPRRSRSAQGQEPRRLRRRRPLLGANPLPASFRVTPEDPDRLKAIVGRAGRRGASRASLGAIDEVRNREEDTNKILSATGLVKALTAGLAALLVFASIALIANTIRLSVFARRREVEVMKLVGATNWFIRWPFVIEGVIVGFFGGAARRAAADDRQGDLHRPAVGPLRAAGRAGHDRLPAARGAADGRLRHRLGDRQRHHAAPLPAGLAQPMSPARAGSRRPHYPHSLP